MVPTFVSFLFCRCCRICPLSFAAFDCCCPVGLCAAVPPRPPTYRSWGFLKDLLHRIESDSCERVRASAAGAQEEAFSGSVAAPWRVDVLRARAPVRVRARRRRQGGGRRVPRRARTCAGPAAAAAPSRRRRGRRQPRGSLRPTVPDPTSPLIFLSMASAVSISLPFKSLIRMLYLF